MKSGAKVYRMYFWSCEDCDMDSSDGDPDRLSVDRSAYEHNYHFHGPRPCPRGHGASDVCDVCRGVRSTIAQVAPSVSR